MRQVMTPSDQTHESREESASESSTEYESDWGLKMSNSPSLGPVETAKFAYRRLRSRF
jgi:hypothetical protein